MSNSNETNSERIITPMPPSLVRAIDDFRYEKRAPSRAEAIRRLIEIGLLAARSGATAETGGEDAKKE